MPPLAPMSMPEMARIPFKAKRHLFKILALNYNKPEEEIRLEHYYLSVVLKRKACFLLRLGKITSESCFRDGILYPNGWKIAFTYEELCWTGEIMVTPEQVLYRAAHVDENGDDTRIVSSFVNNASAAFKEARKKYHEDKGLPYSQAKEKSINGKLLFGCAYDAVQEYLQTQFHEELDNAALEALRLRWLTKAFSNETKHIQTSSCPSVLVEPVSPVLMNASIADDESSHDGLEPLSDMFRAFDEAVGNLGTLQGTIDLEDIPFDDIFDDFPPDSRRIVPLTTMPAFMFSTPGRDRVEGDALLKIQPSPTKYKYAGTERTGSGSNSSSNVEGVFHEVSGATAEREMADCHQWGQPLCRSASGGFMRQFPFTSSELTDEIIRLECGSSRKIPQPRLFFQHYQQSVYAGVESVMSVARRLFPVLEESIVLVPWFLDLLALIECRLVSEIARLKLLANEPHYVQVAERYFSECEETLKVAHNIFSKHSKTVTLTRDEFDEILIAPFRGMWGKCQSDDERNPKRHQGNPFETAFNDCFTYFSETPCKERLSEHMPRMLAKMLRKLTGVPLSSILSKHMLVADREENQ